MSQEQRTIIEAFGLSHIGTMREENQDAIHLCDPADERTRLHGHLYAVADGMGGYAHGAIASTFALTAFCDAFYAGEGNGISQKLKAGVHYANIGVYQEAQRMQAGRMGTTLTAVLIQGTMLHGVHIGDSRAYLLRGGRSTCLTNDHTRVGELVRMKILTADKVRTHNQRSILNRSIGLDLFVQPDIIRVSVQEDDIVLLCSDGVWSVIEDAEFGRLSLGVRTSEELCRTVIDRAMELASDDNLSVLALRLHSLNRHPAAEHRLGMLRLLPAFIRRIAGVMDVK